MSENIINTLVFSRSESHFGTFEIIDADWQDDCGLIAVLIDNKSFMIIYGDDKFLFPEIKLNYPIIRWIDNKTFLVANPRNSANKDNVFILDIAGRVIGSFNCGDGIEDIEVCKDGIWISYFDEGVLGSGISREGLILFNNNGDPIFRYHSDLLEGPSIADCYAICKGLGSSIWLFPYTDFPLLQIFPDTKSLISYQVPKKLHGSNAICIRGKYAYFFGSYKSKGDLYSLEIGKKHLNFLGTIDGNVRGLSNGEHNHFISYTNEFIKLHRVINDNEYDFNLRN
jgi:hypothetical protein